MGVNKTLIQKDNDLVVEELRTMREAARRTLIRASVLFGEQSALAPVSGCRKGVRVQERLLRAVRRLGRASADLPDGAVPRSWSRFFEEPDPHGYSIFHRTLEERRQAMVEPLWSRRLNYETRCLDRRQLQDVSYEAIARLVEIKGEFGALPSAFCRAIHGTIDETRQLLGEMERALLLDGKLLAALRSRNAFLQPQDPCLL